MAKVQSIRSGTSKSEESMKKWARYLRLAVTAGGNAAAADGPATFKTAMPFFCLLVLLLPLAAAWNVENLAGPATAAAQPEPQSCPFGDRCKYRHGDAAAAEVSAP
jgi:hypothetical protein